MKKKNLLIVTPFYSGSKKVMCELFSKHLKSDFNVAVLSFFKPSTEISDKSKLVVLNKNRTKLSLFSIIRSWIKFYPILYSDKFEKVIFVGGTSLYYLPFTFFSPKNKEIITYKHDFDAFRSNLKGLKRLKHYFMYLSERQLLLNSNKIIHKGKKNELSFLPYSKKIKKKPDHLFRDFLDLDLVKGLKPKRKLSEKDKELHLVYVGSMSFTDDERTESFIKFSKRITDQKIHLHVYSPIQTYSTKKSFGYSNKAALEFFRRNTLNNKYFHFEGFRERKKLISELTKYDLGLHFFGYIDGRKSPQDIKVAFSNKNYDYILAGLPIIASSNLETVSDWVKKNKIGIVVDYSEIQDIQKFVKKNNLNMLKRNISKFKTTFKPKISNFLLN